MAPPTRRALTRTDVLSASEVAELLGIHARPSTSLHAVATFRRDASAAAGSSFGIASLRRSHRSTIRTPGGLGTALEIA
jgi:hypothetical protein